MARLTRSDSTDDSDSTTSTGSCIVVDQANTTPAPQTSAMDSARSSIGVPSQQSTPPTSLGDMSSEAGVSKDEPVPLSGRRSSRPRNSIGTYNDKVNAGTAVHTRTAFLKNTPTASSSRAVSGVTLVDDSIDGSAETTLKDGATALDMGWGWNDDNGEAALLALYGLRIIRPTHRGQLENAASNVVGAVSSATTALGKRTRDAVDSAKHKFRNRHGPKARFVDGGEASSEPASKVSRLFPNLRLLEERQKELDQPKQKSAVLKRKKYLAQGLYVGQYRDFDPRLTESKNKKKLQSKGKTAENSVLPLPMFLGEEILKRDRDFQLPYDVLSPLPRDEAPKDWSRLSKNRFIGDAYASWKKVNATLDSSYCECKAWSGGCIDNCINRTMQYECNDSNCRLGNSCGNRAFAELKFRSKNKNFCRRREEEKADQNLWGEGVECVKTRDRGYGVRAMRSFEPGQIIVEYCGEIINQEECDRRMNEEYKDMTDYYLMIFHDKMIIDATRGSIARFVNHSCEPNCRVEKWTVAGEPRMALFAGDDGILTGEELTYDYNFEAFSEKNIQQCLCGAANCRGVLGPKTTKERESKAAKAAAAVSGAYRGAKRKLKEVFSKDDSDDEEESRPKRRKTLPDPKALLAKAKNQLTSLKPAAGPSSMDFDLPNQSREERAARRSASLITLDSRVKDGRISKRRSVSSTFTVAQLKKSVAHTNAKKGGRYSMPLLTSRSTSSSTPIRARTPKATLSSMKESVKRGTNALKTAVNKTPKVNSFEKSSPERRPASLTNLLPSASSSSGMRQSRLSFGHGSFTYVAQLPPTKEDEMRDIAEGKVKIPKRHSSLAASARLSTPAARPGTAQSVAKSVKSYAAKSVKGPQRAAAMARLGLQGHEAVQKTIRHVSGAD